jgi:CRISPR-associated endoribonuclease Cas6/Csy4 subtype I-F
MRHYCTIKIIPAAGFSVPVIAAELVDALHYIYAKKKILFAVAFPGYSDDPVNKTPGDSLRIFTKVESELNIFLDALEVDDRIKPFIHIGRVRKTPENWSGKWVSYARFRIPNNNVSSDLPEYCKEGHAKVRARRLSKGGNLPFLGHNSSSTGQRFNILIQKNVYDHPVQPSGQPDGFGLSRTRNICTLPLLEGI